MIEVGNMLQRMRELGVQGGTGTLSSTDRTALNTEFVALRTEIDRIADNTQWNGDNLLDGSAGANGLLTFQVGYEASQTITVNVGDLNLAAGAATYSAGTTAGGILAADLSAITITTAALSNTQVTHLDAAIAGLDAKRATIGCYLNSLSLPWIASPMHHRMLRRHAAVLLTQTMLLRQLNWHARRLLRRRPRLCSRRRISSHRTFWRCLSNTRPIRAHPRSWNPGAIYSTGIFWF